ncbi:GIY-YIG nuclease family protein [Daejeonella sp.]|uniref:GIY-YIG nuclease family protein n=1 Tax=Daejeonella sp. TaxID=2805397 RepID=UPI0030BCBFAA
MFTVYVLFAPNQKKIYIGFTCDLPNRLRSHNQMGTKDWTIKFRPWELVFTEEFQTKTEAMKREKNLKGAKGRDEIWRIIKGRIHD